MLKQPRKFIGSSPRARGTALHLAAQQIDLRFIPAGAGNRQGDPCQAANFRFIPAGAGNRTMTVSKEATIPVHPRGRGEQAMAPPRSPAPPGSSPRARGTVLSDAQSHGQCRFIPAGAGNRTAVTFFYSWHPVHPRGRGEQINRVIGVAAAPRFIPAGAGNRRIIYPNTARESVHPRGRGEQGEERNVTNITIGSSPRARGTDGRGFDLLGRRRFIPAGAGNRTAGCASPLCPAVHPRGRGEQSRPVAA